ncbi:Ring finger domain [Globisporangium polare]
MDFKNSSSSDGPSARSGAVSSGGGDGQPWWRWSSGASGSISSSSDGVGHGGGGGGGGHHGGLVSEHTFSSSMATGTTSSSSLSSPSESLRWQKRPSASSRGAATPREGGEQHAAFSSSFGGMWSTSPSGGSSSSSSSSSSPSSSSGNSSSSSSSPKFFSASSTSLSRTSSASATIRDASGLKKKIPTSLSPSSSSSPFSPSDSSQFATSSSSGYARSTASSSAASAVLDKQEQPDIMWSLGPTKRRVVRKEKKISKTPAQPRRTSLYAPRAIRPIAEEGRERFTSISSSSHSSIAGERRVSHTTVSEPALRFDSRLGSSSSSVSPVHSPGFGEKSSSPKDRASSLSPSSSFASTSSSSYASPPSYLKKDPVMNCAQAVLQDCIMKRRMERNSSMRKRNLEACVKSDYFNSKPCAYMSKSTECGILSSCSSSSSDDEISQLSSMERSFNSVDNYDDDYKMSKEEMYREAMLRANDSSSSPEFDRFSPFLDEEKRGLPVEIRYQLPLALGTANEIDKECTICQIRYGIGDHIVTLPCQHFFHACCVDKWLWNHISCPLCRTEVSLAMETDASNPKHNFTECSKLDQETIRRKMRSTSQSAGFRPVVPELDQLESQLASLSVQETNQPKYLVCPKPQRPHSK